MTELLKDLPNWLSYTLSITGLAGFIGTAMLYIYQCTLIYPADFPSGSRIEVAKPSDFGMRYTEETLVTKDNIKLRCYIILLDDEKEARIAPTILYFHANAGNMGHRLPIAREFKTKLRCNVVMLSYRGYGLSEGKPNEVGLRIDSQTFLDFVKEHPLLKHTRFIAYGQSIGGAVAIDLVSRNEDVFSGLIVENTFLSIPKLIPHVMPSLRYFTFLCHQNWPSETSVQSIVNTPVLFLSGAQDELVPPSHMQELFERNQTRAEKDWKEFGAGTHNDTFLQPGYFDAIYEFIQRRVLRLEPAVTEEKQAAERAGRQLNLESYQLVSGVADSRGMTQSFQVEEVELEEE